MGVGTKVTKKEVNIRRFWVYIWRLWGGQKIPGRIYP